MTTAAPPAGPPALAAPAAFAARTGDEHKYLIAIAVVLASMMQVIDTSIVNVAIPHMMGELGASLDEIAWVSTGYIVAAVIVMPMTGWLASYFGRKRYFAASVLIFTASSLFCGASHSLGALIFWRVVQGLGGGALITTSQAILFEVFPPEEIGTAMTFFGLGVMVGPTLGPTLGGWLTDSYSWPWIFYINIPIGIVAATMVIVYVHDSAHQVKSRTIDWIGIALLIVTIGALQYLLEHGQSEDWFDSRLIVTLTVVTIISGALLLWRELTVDEPVIDFRVLRNREMWVGTVIGIFFGLALLGSVFVLPIFLQGMLHMTAWQTGLVIMPGSIATAVSMAVVGRLSNRFDPRLFIAMGMTLFFVAMWQLAHITAEAGAGEFYWPLIIRGLSMGMMFVPLTNLTLAGLHPRQIGAGAALSNTARQLGGSLGIAAIATLLLHYTVLAKAVLTEHVSAYDPLTLERLGMLTRGFMARGSDSETARRLALSVIDRQLAGQANVIAFGKVYLLSGAVLLATMPLLLLVRYQRPKARAGPAAPVHAE